MESSCTCHCVHKCGGIPHKLTKRLYQQHAIFRQQDAEKNLQRCDNLNSTTTVMVTFESESDSELSQAGRIQVVNSVIRHITYYIYLISDK